MYTYSNDIYIYIHLLYSREGSFQTTSGKPREFDGLMGEETLLRLILTLGKPGIEK